MPVQTSVTIIVEAPLPTVFDTAASIDARALVKSFGPLPGISDVDGHDAPWSSPGQIRVHRLTDNSSVTEELTDFTRNFTFGYKLSNFSGAFKSLVKGARAEWHFTQLGGARTQIDWTYVFQPKGMFEEPLLWFVVKLFWPGYLRAGLTRVKEKAEAAT